MPLHLKPVPGHFGILSQIAMFQQLTNDFVVCSSGLVQNPQYISAHGCQIIFRYFGNEPWEVAARR